MLGAALGSCVHVAGIQSFLQLAKASGHETVFLGPAVPVKELVAAIRELKPDAVAVSYRLSPETAEALFEELRTELSRDPDLSRLKYYFGGTPPVARLAAATGIFAVCIDGTEPESAVLEIVRGGSLAVAAHAYAPDLVGRIEEIKPVPLIRHHFGLPSLQGTLDGVRRIAESGLVDILSIAPDQNAQEHFFHPEEMNPELDGAGGVPVRTSEDLRAIYDSTRLGNYPLMRCYSGTNDLIRWAGMLTETIHVAWGAVPLTWYSELDGRSKRTVEVAIAENQEAIKWYSSKGIPVEVTESHQWALRRSGDVIEVATSYLAAYNARALGVKDYVCQFMFDTPKGVSPVMDIAKMLAKLELVESLQSNGFRVIRMVRSGLESFSPVPNIAKGQLAASVFAAMALNPQIVHVVGFCEADHVARPEEVIESCEIARGAIMKALLGEARPQTDPLVMSRKADLLSEARYLVEAIKRLKVPEGSDPLTSPSAIAEAVREGLLDASDLKGSRVALGRIAVAIVNGACVAVDQSTGRPSTEKERIHNLAVSEQDLDLAEM